MKSSVSTRRQFVTASAALPLAFKSLAQTPHATPRWVFLGTGVEGIYRAGWNSATGELGKIELAVATDKPDFLAMHPTLPVLYTVNAVAAPKSGLSNFLVDPVKGTLTPMKRVSAAGNGPCFVSVDATGQSAYVANYSGGSVSAFKLGASGELHAVANVYECARNPACGVPGPVKNRQEGPHMHCTTISPGNDFVLSCNLGEDAIEVFPISPGNDKPMEEPMRVGTRAGAGPRHVAFHPNARWVYCINELDCTLDLFDWSVQGGVASLKMRDGATVSALAKGVPLAGKTACEVVVSDDGRFVYACSRGDDTLMVFRVDAATGTLIEQQRLSCGGKGPRHFAFDPSRRWLVCANEISGNVTVFAHEAATGKISETPKSYAAPTPMFVQFL